MRVLRAKKVIQNNYCRGRKKSLHLTTKNRGIVMRSLLYHMQQGLVTSNIFLKPGDGNSRVSCILGDIFTGTFWTLSVFTNQPRLVTQSCSHHNKWIHTKGLKALTKLWSKYSNMPGLSKPILAGPVKILEVRSIHGNYHTSTTA